MYAEGMDNLLGRRHNEDRRATSSELMPQDECRVASKFEVRTPADVLRCDLFEASSRRPEIELNSRSSNDACQRFHGHAQELADSLDGPA